MKKDSEKILNLHIKINGEYLYTDTLPRIRNNITLVPIRAVAEAFGMEIEWNEDLRVVELMHNS